MQMKSTSFPESWPRVSHGVSLAILLIFLNPFFHSPILAPAGMGWGRRPVGVELLPGLSPSFHFFFLLVKCYLSIHCKVLLI